MQPPLEPKIYHIVHIDRLPSILAEGGLLSHSAMQGRLEVGTEIGIPRIKQRRRHNQLRSHPGLYVGQCVPFYFSPKSVMLHTIKKKNNPDLPYRGGQEPIIHLESDLRRAIAWAETNGLRWAFTTSNAGANVFHDYADLDELGLINWKAVHASHWPDNRSEKQAEFLIESRFPWSLVGRVGVINREKKSEVERELRNTGHETQVTSIRGWYY